jgi:hypothetical protein
MHKNKKRDRKAALFSFQEPTPERGLIRDLLLVAEENRGRLRRAFRAERSFTLVAACCDFAFTALFGAFRFRSHLVPLGRYKRMRTI